MDSLPRLTPFLIGKRHICLRLNACFTPGYFEPKADWRTNISFNRLCTIDLRLTSGTIRTTGRAGTSVLFSLPREHAQILLSNFDAAADPLAAHSPLQCALVAHLHRGLLRSDKVRRIVEFFWPEESSFSDPFKALLCLCSPCEEFSSEHPRSKRTGSCKVT
jgi:hypothetical protein